MKLIDTVLLYQERPNAIQDNMIGSIYYHNKDSIFVLQHIPNRLLIINSNAEIKWQQDLNEIFNRNSRLTGLLAFGWFDRIGIYFHSGKLYFGLRQNQADQDFAAPMIGYFDFETDEINTLDIHYPEFYTTNALLGYYSYQEVLLQFDPVFDSLAWIPVGDDAFRKSLYIQLLDSVTDKGLTRPGVTKYDIQEVSADYLIENIDLAFEAWQEIPEAKRASFSAFCYYILPYRNWD